MRMMLHASIKHASFVLLNYIMYIYIYIYTHYIILHIHILYTYVHMYIYIYIERERYIYIYTLRIDRSRVRRCDTSWTPAALQGSRVGLIITIISLIE